MIIERLKPQAFPSPVILLFLTTTNKQKGDESLSLLEVAYIPWVKGGPFPGLYLFTGPARLLRPVLHLATRKVEMIGPMEQVGGGGGRRRGSHHALPSCTDGWVIP